MPHHDHTIDTVPPLADLDREPLGVCASPLGSFMPEGTYRPIPIVWLVSAWVIHSFAMMLLVFVLTTRPLFYTFATTALASLWIAHKTFTAGMDRAATGWKIATVLALLLNWLLAITTGAAMAGY